MTTPDIASIRLSSPYFVLKRGMNETSGKETRKTNWSPGVLVKIGVKKSVTPKTKSEIKIP